MTGSIRNLEAQKSHTLSAIVTVTDEQWIK